MRPPMRLARKSSCTIVRLSVVPVSMIFFTTLSGVAAPRMPMESTRRTIVEILRFIFLVFVSCKYSLFERKRVFL